MGFSVCLCLCICWRCVQASVNLNLRFRLLSRKCITETPEEKQIDNLMKNWEDPVTAKPKLCAARVFLNSSELTLASGV